MKNAILVLVIVAALFMAVGTASAQLTLYIEADGSASIRNGTGSAITFDGCEIKSAGGLLDPVGWNSLADQGLYGFMEFGASSSALTEVSLMSSAEVLPGGALAIGKPAPIETATVEDLTFLYGDSSVSFDMIVGDVVVIPEPVTLTLLGLGGLALIRRRRRA